MAISRTGARTAAAGAIGVLTIITAGAGIATAANGGSLVLGSSNSATGTTTIADKGSTPLSLVTKKGKAPLKVNSNGLVANLNASELGGLTAKSLSSGSTSSLVLSPQALANEFLKAESGGGGGSDTFKGVGLPAPKTGTTSETVKPVKVLSTAKLAAGTYQVFGSFDALAAVCWVGPSSAVTAQNSVLALTLAGTLQTTLKLAKPGVINAYCAAISPASGGPAPGVNTGVFVNGSLTALHLVSARAGTHVPAKTVTVTTG
jgi:hypothetical protein